MKKIIPLFILLSLIACEGRNKTNSAEDRSQNAVENETLTSKFMALVNNHRKSIGLKALGHIDPMVQISRVHSEDMADKSVSFGHTGFSGRCSEAKSAMVGGNLCAENVAMGHKTAEAVFNAWMNSSSHRANIESARLTHCGLGIAVANDGTYYWTHLFLEII